MFRSPECWLPADLAVVIVLLLCPLPLTLRLRLAGRAAPGVGSLPHRFRDRRQSLAPSIRAAMVRFWRGALTVSVARLLWGRLPAYAAYI